jgi:hypothetical protein
MYLDDLPAMIRGTQRVATEDEDACQERNCKLKSSSLKKEAKTFYQKPLSLDIHAGATRA